MKENKHPTGPDILPLKDAHDVALAGGKSINLAKLMEARLPVPDGFVVTTSAFRNAVDGKVGEPLANAIREALRPFAGKRMAARSSATAEDMAGASMAGQYDTFLNLATDAEIIDAIEKCWSSIRSDRTHAYLGEHGIDPDEVAMAVVVQQQASADVAGVLFTVDPRNGSADEMLIEASWGLGESLVSGDVQPDVVRVSAHQKEVISYQVADKQKAIYHGGDGLEAVPDELRKRACLSFEQIIRLQELGHLAANYFGAPQDIEWAIEDGRVLMLQTRPITTLEETRAYNRLIQSTRDYLSQQLGEKHGPWVRHNLGETLPHPTPFSWSLISEFMSGSGGFGKMHEDLGFKPGPAVQQRSFLDRIGGEIYMDCSLMTEMFAEDYPFAYDPALLRKDPDAAQNPPTVARGSLRKIGAAAKLASAAATRIDTLKDSLDHKFDSEYVPQVLEWSKSQEALDLPVLGTEALADLWQAQVAKVLGEFGAMAFLPSMVEAVAVAELRQIIEEHAWDAEPDELVSTLCVSDSPDCTISGNVQLARLAAGELTLESWLAKYGHRTTAEFDLASPRWSERPDDLKRLAAQMSSDSDLEAIHHQRLKEADQCLEKLKQTLAHEDYQNLKAASDLVRRYCRFREDGKFYLMRAYTVLRWTALEIGRRLGIGEDIFFLEPDEAIEAMRTGFVPKGRIADRKTTYQVEPRFQLPHVIESDDIDTLGEALVRADGPALEAHSVSCGSVSGPVAVVLSPDAANDFEKGAILVCPSTDPSWTPLFTRAGGLVLERGGSLSHGAVVAREMGLPAVVLDGATELLQNGEKISIDANAGWIYRDGAENKEEAAQDTHIPRSQLPPPPSAKEGKINRLGLTMALVWGALLAAVFLLPPNLLHDPIMSLLDTLLWPLIRVFGKTATVAIIAGVFGLLPILGQRFLTDNSRLFEAKRRSGLLRKQAAKLPAGSPRRKAMESAASPVTTRILKASMVPLALILGPMIMIFMWFPMRVDPASWSAEPGRMVSIVAEIDGESREPVQLQVPAPLELDEATPEAQNLPPIRAELEELRNEWKRGSDMSELPWEVQSAADHTRRTMLSSLNGFLKEGVPAQKVTWLINVPESAAGAHPVELKVGDTKAAEFKLVFGGMVPPAAAVVEVIDDCATSVTVNYPRALQKNSFFKFPGTNWDLGWLGIYLMAYLPTMFIAKYFLKVP